MHAVSVACCRERPLSSSHFRVSEQQRNDCLFSPSAPAGACSGLPQGHGDPAPLFHAVYHLTAVRGATFLQCHRSTLSTVSVPETSHHIHYSALKKYFWAILTDISVRPLVAKLLIICSLTSGVHAGSKSKFLLMEFA